MALGADHYIESRTEHWVEDVYAATDNQGVDHVLEVIGGSHLGKSVHVVAVGGHICQIGAMDGFELSAAAMPLMMKDVTIHGIGTGSRQALERLIRAVDVTELKPVVDTRYTLRDLPSAFDHFERGAFGKLSIEMGGA